MNTRELLILKKEKLPDGIKKGLRNILVLSTIFLLMILQVQASIFYVSVKGSPQGNGGANAPWDLRTALSDPRAVKPGDTIYILGGIYKGNFTSTLEGTVQNPIIVKNAPGERVIIDGNRRDSSVNNVTTLILRGAFTWYIGLEITNSDTSRTIPIKGSNPKERRGEGVNVFGPGIKVINFIIHDTGQAIGAWKTAVNSEYYGNIIYNNGWNAPDRLHGHGVYSQNMTGIMKYLDNIIFNNFGYGWHIYGSKKAPLNNYYLEGNVCFNDQWLIGGEGPMRNIKLTNNFSYNSPVQMGYGLADNDTLQLIKNYFPAGLYLFWWKNVTASGNTIFNGTSLSSPIAMRFAGPPDLNRFHFDNNIYYSTKVPRRRSLAFSWVNTSADKSDPQKKGLFSLSEWQKAGQDKKSKLEYFPSSTFSKIALEGTKVVVRQNAYDPTRVMLIIYNWDRQSSIRISLDGILKKGERYELHNVQDYFGDIVKGVSEGDGLEISMKDRTVATPVGYDKSMGPDTFPEFGVFMLVKTGE